VNTGSLIAGDIWYDELILFSSVRMEAVLLLAPHIILGKLAGRHQLHLHLGRKPRDQATLALALPGLVEGSLEVVSNGVLVLPVQITCKLPHKSYRCRLGT
jgi:hypothetical protein